MKTYLLCLALLLSGFALSAQEVLLFDDTQEATLVYRYSQLSGPYASSLRSVLRTLVPTQPQTASLDVAYRYHLRILEGKHRIKNCLDWELVEATRAPRPHGFGFEDVLQPTGVSYNLELLANGKVVQSNCVEQTFGTTLPAHTFDFTEVAPQTYYTLRVRDLNFKYEYRHVQAAQQRMRQIDQYLIAKDRLIALHLSLQAFRQLEPQPGQLDSYRTQVREYEEQLRKITRAAFWSALQLDAPDAYDPEQLREHVAHCEAEIVAWRQWLNELAARIHILYFEQGVAAWQNGDRHAAYTAFRASLAANDCYAPSHYFMAYLDFEDGKVEAAGARIIRVLNDYNPDPNTRLDAERLAGGIMRFYLDAGQNAVALRQYPEGVAAYEQALAFGDNIRGFDFGRAEALSRIQEAYTLDLHDRLDQVVHTRQSGQPALALEQLNTALDFQQRFRVNTTYDIRQLTRAIVNDLYADQLARIREERYAGTWDQALALVDETEALLADYPGLVAQPQQLADEKERVLLGKYQSLVAEVEDLLRRNQLDAALQTAEAAHSFVDNYQLDAHRRDSEQLILRVQQQRYERFVRGGDRARQATDYGSALEQYARAQQLERQLAGLQPITALRQNIVATALLEAERIQGQALQQAATDNHQLQAATAQLHTLAGRFDLHQEARFVSLVAQLDHQQCVNARETLLPRETAQLAQDQRTQDYIAARATLGRIAQLLESYPDCGLDATILREQEQIVAACAQYQEQLAAAAAAEARERYGEAIRQYAAARISYENAAVRNRLAAHPGLELYEYIAGHESYRMTLAGGHYYLDLREHDRAFTLLEHLIERGVHPQDTEGLQERLGSALAVRHFVATADWKTTFYGYVAKDERKLYRDMYRSFRKQWRRMV